MRRPALTRTAAAALAAFLAFGTAACDDDVEAELNDLGSAVEEDIEGGENE